VKIQFIAIVNINGKLIIKTLKNSNLIYIMSITYINLAGNDGDLDVSRAIVRDKALLGNGRVSDPSISFLNDSDTGLYSDAINSLSVSTGGTQRARFDNQGLELQDGTLSAPSISFLNEPDLGIYRNSLNNISFVNGNSVTMTIGAASISNFLPIRVVNGSASNPSIFFNSSNTTGIFQPSSNVLGVSAGGIQALTISSSLLNSSVNIRPSSNATLDLGGSSNMFDWFYTNRINNGAVFTANVPSIGARSTGCRLVLRDTFSSNVQGDYALGVSSASLWYQVPTTSQAHRFFFGDGENFAIANNAIYTRGVFPYTNGNQDLGSTTLRYRDCYLINNPNVSSDERIKTNIEDLQYGLNLIESLQPKQYLFKNSFVPNDNKLKWGLIAQDVEALLNQNINYQLLDKGNDEDPDNIIYKSLDYTSLIPVLINAVKELSAQVKLLKSQINK